VLQAACFGLSGSAFITASMSGSMSGRWRLAEPYQFDTLAAEVESFRATAAWEPPNTRTQSQVTISRAV